MPIPRLQGENNVIIRVSSMIALLVLINLLTLLCCLPIITIGAALTSMHDVLQMIIRKEDGYVTRRYFSSFRKNMKQATLLWVPFLFIFSGCVADVIIIFSAPGLIPGYIMIPAGVAGLFALFVFQWVFPLQARFKGNFGVVMKMSFLLAVARFPRTFVMAAVCILPVIAVRSILTLPLVMLFGISVPGIIGAKIYHPVFTELEQEEEKE
jgi:uncharacterized membrane protein YesL